MTALALRLAPARVLEKLVCEKLEVNQRRYVQLLDLYYVAKPYHHTPLPYFMIYRYYVDYNVSLEEYHFLFIPWLHESMNFLC